MSAPCPPRPPVRHANHWRYRLWRRLLRVSRELYTLGIFLKPTAFHFVAAMLPLVIYVMVAQGAEILSMMGEALLFGPEFRPWAPALFVLGNAAAGFTIWWCARLMLEFAWQPPVPPSRHGFAGLRQSLQVYWPRLLGVLPLVWVAVACVVRITHYGKARTAVIAVAVLAIAHLVAAFLLWRYFAQRRHRLGLASEPRYRSFAHRYRNSPGSRRIQYSLLGLSFATFALLWLAPHHAAPLLGTGAMLALAAVAWVTIGTHLVTFSARTRIPVLSLLALWLVVNSSWMDNHHVHLSPGEHPLTKEPSVEEAYQSWHARQPAASAKPRPLFLVATEGGGIRAAYWTAMVLATLQEESLLHPDPSGQPRLSFAEDCFAISGVSGGSVGAAVFDALVADGRKELVDEARQILGTDHLAPLVGSLLFPDALQRAIPFAVPGTDRGRVLERSWELAYHNATGSDRLAGPFHETWTVAGRPAAIPHLLLNSTSVNTGQRVIFSDLAISMPVSDTVFFDAIDMREVLYKGRGDSVQPWDIALSSAAHNSARFTYTNPAGLLTSRERVVDGGYFENTGAATLCEVLSALRKRHRDFAGEGVQPVVIIISNDPQRRPEGSLARWEDEDQARLQNRLTGTDSARPVAPGANENTVELQATEPQRICSELLSPPRAILHTREARGTMALETIEHEMAELGRDQPGQPRVIRFGLIDRGIPLPLGWSLSQQAAEDMYGQSWSKENGEAIEQVLRWLGVPTEPPAAP